jgi:hypothetical protein
LIPWSDLAIAILHHHSCCLGNISENISICLSFLSSSFSISH